jgi:hypothetical protein
MALLAFDSDRWRTLGQSVYGPVDLRALLEQVDRLPSWSGDEPSFETETPLVQLALAISDGGNISEAAYAVVPHLLAMARRRGPRERLVPVELMLDIVLGDWEEDRPVPDDLRPGFVEALRACGPFAARAVAVGLPLRIGSARTIVSAVLLSDGRTAAADLVHRVDSSALELECPACRTFLTVYVDVDGLEIVRTQALPEPVPTGPRRPPTDDAPAIREALAVADALGARPFLEALAQLDGPQACIACRRGFRPITALSPALRRFSPLERPEPTSR